MSATYRNHLDLTLARLTQARAVLEVVTNDGEAGKLDRLSFGDVLNLLWTVDTLLEQAGTATELAYKFKAEHPAGLPAGAVT
ncbi:MAG: hypothetical protein NTV11_20375 [Rhodocyclales bacterium]|nr:hypothetical protein [Rhodocyclales bacterium]